MNGIAHSVYTLDLLALHLMAISIDYMQLEVGSEWSQAVPA